MTEKDRVYFESVVETYHDAGESIRETAARLDLSRTKVRKILITMGEIRSEITDRALELMKQGKSQQQIAEIFCISEATLSTYLPYGDRVFNREEKTSDAIRSKGYRTRQAIAAGNQVHKSEKRATNDWDREEGDGSMKKDDRFASAKVLKLRMELDTKSADMEVLKRYGKVKSGITRDILVSNHYTLHALHYVIQKLFGWQNSHLHHFYFTDEDREKLVLNSFKQYCKLCGMYFRFFYHDDEDMDDIYWDDDYEEGESFKTWLRKKYRTPFRYEGAQEHYLIAQMKARSFEEENQTLEIAPSFAEWMNGNKDNRIVTFDQATYDEMYHHFECRLGELIERASVGEFLSHKPESLDVAFEDMRKRDRAFEKDFEELLRLDDLAEEISDKSQKLLKYGKKKHADPDKLRRDSEEILDLDNAYQEGMDELFYRTNKAASPITDHMLYAYDYGDGWKVKISIVEEYSFGGEAETIGFYQDGVPMGNEMNEILWEVLWDSVPVCVAADGLPVMDDVGGIYGYCEFLKGIHGIDNNGPYEDKEESREWARGMGWTGRMSKPENML